MQTLKMNFTVPEDVVNLLKANVEPRKRSAFVASAIQQKLESQELERLTQDLIEGYSLRRDEDKELDAEWEGSTLEGWM